jgi:predicted polyphosphate/ATP-dependent NAD kinase
LHVKKLGVIVNPIAGMGGRVGLKGSDGLAVLGKARELGALPESPMRAIEALRVVSRIRNEVEIITYPREMGEHEALECGFTPTVIGSVAAGPTTSEDTMTAAREMMDLGVDLLLFAGGDGTARDIHDAVGQSVLALGIPAGVKIHSAVYAVTPTRAGELAVRCLEGRVSSVREAEVMDVDEEAFRAGTVAARLYGYLRVPEDRRFVQSGKAASPPDESDAARGIASEIVRRMEEGCLYIIGPGTTTRQIMEELGLENTLLGVDVVLDKGLVAGDVNERDLLELTEGRRAKIVVTVIGGQGYILGRGNQQLSPEVVRKVGEDNIIVVATRDKLASLDGRPLLVDTGDTDLDQALNGYTKVTVDFNTYAMYRVGT